jgi:hypothetical protein
MLLRLTIALIERVFEEQQKAFEETGQMVDVTPDVVVGRAGRGIVWHCCY